MKSGWQPILEHDQAARGWQVVDAIAADLAHHLDDAESVTLARRWSGGSASLAGGDAGMSLFFAVLAQGGQASVDAAAWRDRLLRRAADALASVEMAASFFDGFAGIAWAVQQFLPAWQDGAADPLDGIDAVLVDCLARNRVAELDVTAGLAGIGVYLLSRAPRPAAASGLQAIVAQLAQRAERPAAGGVTWRVPPAALDEVDRVAYPAGRYDLGVAHGVAGIMAFLARVAAAGIETAQATDLLQGAVAWLLRQARDSADQCRFPYWVAPVGAAVSSVPAWCYGDLGIALALLATAFAAGRADWQAEAIDLGLFVAERSMQMPPKVDAGICHGTSGVAHQFNRLFQATGRTRFRDAARYWYEQTFRLQAPGTGIGGFRALIRDENFQDLWIASPELLSGAAGIGLGLLAGLLPHEPTWDRMLLISPLPVLSADVVAGSAAA